MNTDRYYRFSTYLRERFETKVYKVSIDAGFSCPNFTAKRPISVRSIKLVSTPASPVLTEMGRLAVMDASTAIIKPSAFSLAPP